MKKILFSLLMICVGSLSAQPVINNFDEASADTNYWAFFDNHSGQHYQTSDAADSAYGWINISYPADNVAEGTGAMRLDYSAHNSESWGGYTKLEHWNPDSNGVYNWSMYDTLSIWYNNIQAQDQVGRVHLRINLHDVSDTESKKIYDVTQTEYYYSFLYILDDEPGWNQVKMPLVSNASWDGNGFNLTGWSGISGNSELDLDQIKGFSFEFSISGGGEGDYSQGAVILDNMELTGLAEKPFMIFNGKTLNSSFGAFTWGQSGLEIVEGGGEDPKTNAILWTQGDEWSNGWSGAGWNVTPPYDLSARWDLDSMKFKAKVDPGTGAIRMQLESGDDGKVGHAWTPIDDGEWHVYSLALVDFQPVDGTTNFNNAAISVVQMMGEDKGDGNGSAVAGQKIYYDYLWTGNPVIDVSAPDAPQLVSAVGGDYTNLVTWVDVPGEQGETYSVYVSFDPITDLANADVVATGITEGLQVVEHTLKAPEVDQEVTYYYAVVCVDGSGNTSPIGAADLAVTNTAKGVTVISPVAPANFVADGDLSEWTGITPFEMNPDNGTGFIPANQEITNAADCSAIMYVAMDDEYLYVAYDVTDDVINTDHATSYEQDSPDLFIGLYDWRGPLHSSYKRGEEPDYQWRFNRASAIIGSLSDHVMATPEDENYSWTEKFPSGYVVEGKFAFADIAAVADPDDALFKPIVGKRIRIDFSINDADLTGEREGILTYSPENEDQSWSDPRRWVYTWIGDQFVDVEDENIQPAEFGLAQNYPNPFNPTTQIKYSIQHKSNVTLKVFNLLGQEVASLVNDIKAPGSYVVNFDASNLATGIYVYQITAGSFVSTKKMMLIK